MLGYTRLGRTGLTTSRVGFGAYRVDDTTPQHRKALRKALVSGVNLIDTSTNYTDGGSERLVGSVVRGLIAAGDLNRDEVIIVSKIGYVQGQNLELARAREERGDGYAEMVKYQPGLWHCMHPDFIRDQLQRSLDRLELATLDVCLLHNPEYFLIDAERRGESASDGRAEFYRRLERAFAELEEQVTAGRLSWYGVSSNTLVAPTADPASTSLSRMLEAARAAAGEAHHFAVLQLPLNLLEPGAVFERKEGAAGDRTVLELAGERNLAVLVNRPLNAVKDDTLIRLVDVKTDPERKKLPPPEEQLSRVAELEAAFRERIATMLGSAPGSASIGSYFRWSDQLHQVRARVHGLADWSPIESQIRAAVRSISAALDQSLSDEVGTRWRTWRVRYHDELDRLLRSLRREAAEQSATRSERIRSAIDPLLPESRRSEGLSRTALWTVASTPGVTCVLNGMRRSTYVADAVGILRWPALESPEPVYRAAADLDLS